MTMRVALGALAYILPTFPLGYVWHLVLFRDHYQLLAVYRNELIFPFGIGSMLIQGVVWAYLYARLFSGEPILRGAWKFGCIAFPLVWSFLVLAVAAKHRMADVSGYVLIESAFTVVQYLVLSPLIAWVFSIRKA